MATYFINQKALDELGNLVDEEDENFYSDFHDMLVNDMAEYATIVRDFDLKLAKAKKLMIRITTEKNIPDLIMLDGANMIQ